MLNEETLVEVIIASLLGKYEHIGTGQARKWIKETISSVSHCSDVPSLVSHLATASDARTDITNQTVVLHLIAQFPRDAIFEVHPIQAIHNLLLGKESYERKLEFVPDFGGIAPTSIQQTEPRFDEVERYFSVLMELDYPGHKSASYLLAHIFSSIIRIHYFADGNGRAARFASFLLLGCWGQTPISIPKVRNDCKWKEALDLAIQGNLDALAEQMEARVRYRGAE